MMEHSTPSSRRDPGFTLVEVIVTMLMIGLVSIVIAGAITVIFRSQGSAVRVASESHDTQQGVNYFPLDVQAGPTELAAYQISATASGCVTAGTNVLDFVKGNRRVSYRLEVSGTSERLNRYTCDNTGTAEAPVWSNPVRVNIADSLDASASPSAGVTLTPAADGTLQSAQLTLAQNGSDPVLIASPRAEPRTSSGDCQTENPLEASNGYGVYVETGVVLKKGELTGWLGLGGTLSWESDIMIATGNMSGVDPKYGLFANDVDWTTNVTPELPKRLTVDNESAAFGNGPTQTARYIHGDPLAVPSDPANTDNYIYLADNPIRTADAAGAQLDFTADFDELRDCSADLARALDLCASSDCANEVDITLSSGVLNFCSSRPVPQILNLPEQYLDGSYSFDSSGPGCQGFSQSRPLIVNVIEDPLTPDTLVTINTDQVDWTAVGDRKNILFNFPNAFEVDVLQSFWGEILAPFAHVQTYADVAGGVIARQWTHHDGVIDANDDIYNNPINFP